MNQSDDTDDVVVHHQSTYIEYTACVLVQVLLVSNNVKMMYLIIS
jgi:hypothetical protein